MNKLYTFRASHLERPSNKELGDTVLPNDIIGVMGNTGQSTASHVHCDVVIGSVPEVYHQSEIRDGLYTPSPEQLLFFMDDGFFKYPMVITTGYADVAYFTKRKKIHYGFDMVPKDRKITKEHFTMYWNRTKHGVVVGKGFDPGYGNYIHIAFTA